MFVGAIFHLTEPICSCARNHLCWDVRRGREGVELKNFCAMCHATLTVGPQQFVANFVIEKPYPGVTKDLLIEKKESPTLSGNVIPFRPKKK